MNSLYLELFPIQKVPKENSEYQLKIGGKLMDIQYFVIILCQKFRVIFNDFDIL